MTNQHDNADINKLVFESDDELASEQRPAASSPNNAKKTIATIISWTLLCSGSVAVALSLSGVSLKETSLELYNDFFPKEEAYASIITDESKTKTKKVQEILSDLGDGYSPNLLLNLTEDEFNEVNKLNGTIPEATSVQTKKADTFISAPPTADTVISKINQIKNEETAIIEDVQQTDETTPITTTQVAILGTEESSVPEIIKAPLRPDEPEISPVISATEIKVSAKPDNQETPKPAFVVSTDTKAPLRPAQEPIASPTKVAEAQNTTVSFGEDSMVFKEQNSSTQSIKASETTSTVSETAIIAQKAPAPSSEPIVEEAQDTVSPSVSEPKTIAQAPDTTSAPVLPPKPLSTLTPSTSSNTSAQKSRLKLEDLLYGLNWNTKKADISTNIERCITITEKIEGCRLNFKSWLPDSRYIVGLFEIQNAGKLVAIQIDSYPFQNNTNINDSFETASRIITGKLANEKVTLREELVPNSENIISLLATDKTQRHYRHWSLSEIQIPAYIHSSIKTLNKTEGFHRTLFIETELTN